MTLSQMLHRGEKLVSDNSPTILTVIGVVGSLTGAYMTGKASFRAAEVLRQEDKARQDYANAEGRIAPPLTNQEIFNLTWKLYVPPAVALSLSTAAVVGANRVGTRRAAAMATAYGLSEKAYAEYKEKVIEKIGENKERAVRAEIAEDRVRKNPPPDNVRIQNGGDQLVMEHLTNRYFFSSVEELRQAEAYINNQILKHGYASLSDFYDKLGQEHTSISDDVGWTSSLEPMELRLTPVMGIYHGEERSVIMFDYNFEPIRDYDIVH